MRRRVPDSILDRSYCPKCGKAVIDLIYEIHVLRCKGNENFDFSSIGIDEEEDEDYTYQPIEFPSFEAPKTERCPYCGEEVSENLYNLHTLTCDEKEDYSWTPFDLSDKDEDYTYQPIEFPSFEIPNTMYCSKCGEDVPISSFSSHASLCTDNTNDYEWHSIYRIEDSTPYYPLDDALKHDAELFRSSNVLRLYDESYDYSDRNMIRKPLEFAEFTGELMLSTAVERRLTETLGGSSLPSFGESFMDNVVTSIPTSGISFIYGKPSSAGDELGLAGAAGLAAFVMGGPVAALTVVGLGFFKAILRKIFG